MRGSDGRQVKGDFKREEDPSDSAKKRKGTKKKKPTQGQSLKGLKMKNRPKRGVFCFIERGGRGKRSIGRGHPTKKKSRVKEGVKHLGGKRSAEKEAKGVPWKKKKEKKGKSKAEKSNDKKDKRAIDGGEKKKDKMPVQLRRNK